MLAGLADDGFAAALHVTFSGRWHDFFSACGVIGRVREVGPPFLSGDPQPEQGLTPIVALSVVQIERGIGQPEQGGGSSTVAQALVGS